MSLALQRAFRWLLVFCCFLLVSGYLVLITFQFAGVHFAGRANLVSLETAVRLQPDNADYYHRLGRYLALIAQNPSAAVEPYRAAVRLNPYSARYWFDLAAAYQLLGDVSEQEEALEHATRADPTTPDVAWEAGNLYLVRGETGKALREFRVVLQNDVSFSSVALQLCWRALPDVDALLQQVVPSRIESRLAFLDLLMAKKETAGTRKVWSSLLQLGQPFPRQYAFDYVKFLVLQRAVEEAALSWQQSAGLLGYSAYLPSATNLVVNGDFNLDVLNGGLDWNYHRQNSVELSLDPSDFHGGHRSLSILFDGPGVSDAGIYQLVPVQPDTTYEFSAYFKTGEIEGAGGPQLVLQDFYSNHKVFESDELKNAEYWKPINGELTTSSDTRLLVLGIERTPAGSPIRGKLWVDDFHLVPR